MTEIYITVKGGVVSEVFSSEEIKVKIIDFDATDEKEFDLAILEYGNVQEQLKNRDLIHSY